MKKSGFVALAAAFCLFFFPSAASAVELYSAGPVVTSPSAAWRYSEPSVRLRETILCWRGITLPLVCRYRLTL